MSHTQRVNVLAHVETWNSWRPNHDCVFSSWVSSTQKWTREISLTQLLNFVLQPNKFYRNLLESDCNNEYMWVTPDFPICGKKFHAYMFHSACPYLYGHGCINMFMPLSCLSHLSGEGRHSSCYRVCLTERSHCNVDPVVHFVAQMHHQSRLAGQMEKKREHALASNRLTTPWHRGSSYCSALDHCFLLAWVAACGEMVGY